MMELYFRCLTGNIADFIADLNAFCAASGYEALFPDGSLDSVQFQDISRFDFVAFPITIDTLDGNGNVTSTDNRGLHVNASMTLVAGADPGEFAAKATLLQTNMVAYFSSTFTNTAPVLYPANGGQVWPATTKTAWINSAPAVCKMVGA